MILVTPTLLYTLLSHRPEFSAPAPPVFCVFLTVVHFAIREAISETCGREIWSTQKPNGTIRSPSGPNSYPQSVRCAYTFRSSGQERAQIVFKSFNLYKSYAPEEDERKPICDPSKDDHLVVYVKTAEEHLSEIDTFCGHVVPPQVMSSRNELRMEFITFRRPPDREVKYHFSFDYHFVTNFGIDTGVQTNDHVCSFDYYSTGDVKHGIVRSPNYPGYYPRNTDCHYTFHGGDNEKVLLQFTYFQVEGFMQCDNESRSDYVEFSNYQTHDRNIPRYCGSRSPERVESERNFFRMIFHSNNLFDATGFEAFYQFHEDKGPSIRKVKAGSSNVNQGSLPLLLLVTTIILST